jgi:2,3-dihydroxybiphenyl 1,2-dioxygenase
MDDRCQRLVVAEDAEDGLGFCGWEVADAAALDATAARLEAAGVRVERGPRALADERRVAGLIRLRDPLGNRVELIHGAETTAAPFAPGRAISGFRTGPLGMGHAVLNVPSMEAVLPFYRDLLGFGVSDWVEHPFRATFLRVNPRHHSLALIETGRAALHHIMVELFSLDDVGQGYDLAQAEPDRVATTLGRHTNDFMTSFYARAPGGGFMFEYGWGGRSLDPATWTPVHMEDGPSLWGHERRWGSDEMRAAAHALRLGAGAKGLRAPVQVVEGNHVLARGECAWWDAAVRARNNRDALEPLQNARETDATPARSRPTRPRGRENPSAW